ncbi:MAG: hypothetical protein AB1635_15640 [Acidobacteriota bacterium]
MSGANAARALQAHFEEVRKSELTRLRKKVAALSADQQAAVDAITASVIRGIARRPAAALARDGSPALVRAVVDLFRMAQQPVVTRPASTEAGETPRWAGATTEEYPPISDAGATPPAGMDRRSTAGGRVPSGC